MESSQPAAPARSRRRRSGRRVALILLACVAWPASATAGPLEEAAQRPGPAAQAGDGPAEAVATAVPQTAERSSAGLAPNVEPERVVEPVGSAVGAVAATEPVRSDVDAVREPVAEVSSRVQSALAGAADGAGGAAQASNAGPSPGERAGAARRGRARVDEQASERAGGGTLATEATSPASLSASTAAGELPRADASSIAASGDGGGGDGQSLLGHGGDAGLLGAPAGVALVALGLLVALLTLIPRFSSRMLQMSPARWGPSAFLVPIERPG